MSRYEQLERMLQAEPNDAFLNFGMAMELAKRNHLSEAVERFERVSQIDPAYVAAYYHHANTLARMGKADRARAILEAGIHVAENLGDTHAASEMRELGESLTA